jgi:hypothetical protein
MMENDNVDIIGVDPVTGLPMPVLVSRSSLRVNEIAKTRINGRLPAETNIIDMLAPGQVKKLSPALKTLTKKDLVALGGWSGERVLSEDLGLTFKDIQTIRDVFGQGMIPERSDLSSSLAIDISCCCCTPCCCAAAQIRPIQKVA